RELLGLERFSPHPTVLRLDGRWDEGLARLSSPRHSWELPGKHLHFRKDMSPLFGEVARPIAAPCTWYIGLGYGGLFDDGLRAAVKGVSLRRWQHGDAAVSQVAQ